VQVADLKKGEKPVSFPKGRPAEMATYLAGLLTTDDEEARLKLDGATLRALDGVLLCGGWVNTGPGSALSYQVRHAPEGGYFAVSAEEWPWGSRGEVLAVDMGKSYIKTGFGALYRRFARNFNNFPLRRPPNRERRSYRRKVAEFMGRKLAAMVREAGYAPATLLLAFPCKVSPEGTPEEEAWPGMAGWENAGPEIAVAAGLGASRLIVCNDAELAALSAWHSPLTADWNHFAVLTVGTALGLALVDRASS
jgi:hypothetical protein